MVDPARLGTSDGAESIASSSSSSSSGDSEGESESESDSDSDSDSECGSSGDNSSSSGSDESDSSDDSDVAVISTESASLSCANTPVRDSNGSSDRSSRPSTARTGTAAKTALNHKRPKEDAPSRVDVDLTEDNEASQGTFTSTGTSTTVVGNGRHDGNEGTTVTSSSLHGTGRGPKACGEDGSAIPDNRGPEGVQPAGDELARAVPVGIPTRGPAVLYRCRVLHGVGSSFLVLSCPNIDYIRAVLKHSIVQSARREDR